MGLWNTAQWSFIHPRANFIIIPYPNCCCGSKVSKTKEQAPAPRLQMGKDASIPSCSWKISNSIAWEDQQQVCKPKRFSESISMQQQTWGKRASSSACVVFPWHVPQYVAAQQSTNTCPENAKSKGLLWPRALTYVLLLQANNPALARVEYSFIDSVS